MQFGLCRELHHGIRTEIFVQSYNIMVTRRDEPLHELPFLMIKTGSEREHRNSQICFFTCWLFYVFSMSSAALGTLYVYPVHTLSSNLQATNLNNPSCNFRCICISESTVQKWLRCTIRLSFWWSFGCIQWGEVFMWGRNVWDMLRMSISLNSNVGLNNDMKPD